MARAASDVRRDSPVPARPRRGVLWRIMLRQAPLLLILLAGVLYWLERHLENAHRTTNLSLARNTAHLAAAVVQASMLSTETHRAWARVEERLSAGEGTEIEIVNLEGRVLYATDPAERDRTHQLTDPCCSVCHPGGSKTADAQAKFVRSSGESLQIYAAPIGNTTDCRRCHQDDGPKLGMVYVRQSFAPVSRLIRTTQIGLVIAGGISLLLTVSLTRLLLGRYLGGPLKRLVSHARAIGSGDLDARVDVPQGTELSVLAGSLNQSAEQLKRSFLKIERQRDDLRTLYEFADHLGQSTRPDERCRRAVELTEAALGSDCVLVAGHFHPESHAFHGTVTYRVEGSGIVERPYPDEEVSASAPFYSYSLVEWWLEGKLDEKTRIRTGGTVAYPLRRRQLRLGLILAPARDEDESFDGRMTAATPAVVQALRKHLAIALELSELQRQRLEQERLAAIGETVAGLSHCLKNTLNGLQGGAYVVERALKQDDPAKLEQGWKILTNGVRHIERLTLDMLFYAGERSFSRAPTDPNRILDEVFDLLEESAADQGVALRKEHDETMVPVSLERHAVYRAVLNLVTNAIDACVDSETGDTVTLRSRLDPDQVVLTVEDNGVGIPPALVRRVTERFFTTKSARGTGLGLPVVKKIAEEHGGRLEVESEFGRGSAFHLVLPRKTDEPIGTE